MLALHGIAACYNRSRRGCTRTIARGVKKNCAYGGYPLNGYKPASPEASKLIDKTAAYLKKHATRIDNGTAKLGGYHIGTGAIESAHKLISHVRLKRPEAWWYPGNANNVLRLRCAKYNGTYEKVMDQYRDKDRKQKADESPDQETGLPDADS